MAKSRVARSLKVIGTSLAALLLGAAATPAPATRTGKVRITWVGGPTLLLRFGPVTVVTDPVLGEGEDAFRMFDPNTGRENASHGRMSPLPEVPIEEADLVLLSHDHGDHLDETGVSRLGALAAFIAPAAQAPTVRGRNVSKVIGLRWGESYRLARGGYSVTVTAVAARHSPVAKVSAQLGDVNGYWLDFRHGRYRRTIYWTGDSFPEPAAITRSLRHPDLLVPHLGGVGEGGPFGKVSMGAAEGLSFARLVDPRAVLPIHHSTFSLYREPIEKFANAARAEPWALELLDEGEELVLR